MLEQRADLHVHTVASDGIMTPEKVVEGAASVGLSAVGITDHDTVGGIKEGIAAGERFGILVVPGIEINTDFGKKEIHMLGYFIDIESSLLKGHLDILRSARMERGAEMVRKLNRLGINITIERVMEIAGSGSVGRPHVARAIVEAGYASGMNGAFGKYLVRNAPGYVPHYKLTPAEAVEVVKGAGGVAVMAHPGQSKSDEIIPTLAAAGMQGLEVNHPDHSSAQRRHYTKLAKRYGLIATGGSDFHGPDMLKMNTIGSVTVDISAVEALHALSSANLPYDSKPVAE